MAISLGYNRLSSMQSDTEQVRQQKIYIFWMVYIFDTGFSIRLGRSPVIRDHDITVPMVSDNGVVPTAFVGVLRYWIELGRVQCQAVEHLFSPAALQQPPEERSKRADKLAVRLQEVWDAREVLSLSHALQGSPASYLYLLRESDAIIHYSTVALVQHATMSAQNGASPALGAARHALWLSIDIKKRHKDLPESMWSAPPRPIHPLHRYLLPHHRQPHNRQRRSAIARRLRSDLEISQSSIRGCRQAVSPLRHLPESGRSVRQSESPGSHADDYAEQQRHPGYAAVDAAGHQRH
jgi:hypothetical protein